MNYRNSDYAPVVAQMSKDFWITMGYDPLSPAARKVAWASALGRLASASACYRAIARSLEA